ncbi:MAG: hypothetical protein RXR09_02025 [Acidilobus sp.]
MSQENRVSLQIDNMKLNLDGRVYESSHMIVVGLKRLSGEVSFGTVKVKGEFDLLPQASTVEDVVEVSAGGTFESDAYGGSVAINELEDGYLIEFNKLTIKFDVDESTGKVSVKIPRLEPIKASKLLFDIKGTISLNMIVSPFVVGAMTLVNDGKIKITAGDEVKITTEPGEGGANKSKELQIQRAQGRA